MAQKTFLFVYGTLKRGERNHRLLADQEFVAEATTAPKYRVYDLGPYPGLVCDGVSGLAVSGEVFAVTECALAELDDFEGVPTLFERKPIEIEGYSEVWAYFTNAVPEGAKSGSEWPLG